jgi:hypothetical protein
MLSVGTLKPGPYKFFRLQRQMHLRAHVAARVRKREVNWILATLGADPSGWPNHLRLAWKILRDDLRVPPQAAHTLIVCAVNAAHECAYNMNERTQATALYERSKKLKAAFGRLSRCVKRAPARLRHLLDENVATVLKAGDVDLEVIEGVLQASRTAFEHFLVAEASRTGLSALGVYTQDGYDTLGLIADFSALSPPLKEKCKSALSLAIKSGSGIGAAAVFKVLADAVSIPAPLPRGASDILIPYVAAVAAAWRSGGLRAGRALKPNDSRYTSKFHLFCDLVLTALVEPESRRHGEGLDQLAKKAWARQRRLPRELQKYVRGGLSRKDSQWLVTAHCLREGLRLAASKKSV